VYAKIWGSRDPGHDPFLDFPLWIFEILPLRICVPNFKSLALLVLEICYHVLITKYIVQPIIKVKNCIAHAPRHVTWGYVVRSNHIFGILDPDLSIHYTTFRGLR